jgi:hypothetical protein
MQLGEVQQKEIPKLQKALEEAKREWETATDTIAQLQTNLAKTNQAKELLAQQLEVAKKETIPRLAEKLNQAEARWKKADDALQVALTKTIPTILKDLAEAKEERETASKQFTMATATVAQLKSDLARSNDAREAIARQLEVAKKETIPQLEGKFTKAERERKETNDKLHRALAKATQLQTDLNQARAELERTRTNAVQVQAELDRIRSQCDLQVTITWDTNHTDIDLRVTEPGGTLCYYGHRNTANGGQLSADIRDGFGPEQYKISNGPRGTYLIAVHYFSASVAPAPATQVTVEVVRHPGTAAAVVERYTVTLQGPGGDPVEVCRVQF